jgi:Domain of unknown function (DUF4406)
MKIYIANKMTGIEEYNFPWFDRARDYLNSLGHEAVSPADLDKDEGFNGTGDVPANMSMEACLRRDFRVIVNDIDAIAFGPLWADSRGARAERTVGQYIGLPFYRIDPDSSTFYKEFVIGLAGYARAGKDTVAQMIVQHGFEQRSFATPLKEALYALNPLLVFPLRVQDVVDDCGWEEAKSRSEVRSLLQRLGTEAGRNVLGQDVWVNALFNTPNKGRLVISDVRFPNEAQAIKARGGLLWRVERPGTGPANAHMSETALDGYDYDGIIDNTGDLDELEITVKNVVSKAIT